MESLHNYKSKSFIFEFSEHAKSLENSNRAKRSEFDKKRLGNIAGKVFKF